MKTLSSYALAIACASMLVMGSASAQTTPDTAAKAAPAAKAEKPRTPESIACSKEADDKNIHGKARHKFMSKCKKDAKAGAAKDAK
jgi:hypothetical protein